MPCFLKHYACVGVGVLSTLCLFFRKLVKAIGGILAVKLASSFLFRLIVSFILLDRLLLLLK